MAHMGSTSLLFSFQAKKLSAPSNYRCYVITPTGRQILACNRQITKVVGLKEDKPKPAKPAKPQQSNPPKDD